MNSQTHYTLVTITILDLSDQRALVQWTDPATKTNHRAYIPPAAVVNVDRSRSPLVGQADLTTLGEGIEYGEHWELLPVGRTGAGPLAAALRARGIWTYADALKNISAVRAALADATAADLATILNAAKAAHG